MLVKFLTKRKIIVELPDKLYQSLGLSKIKNNFYQLNERCGIIIGTRDNSEKIRVTHLIEDKIPIMQSPFQVLRETSHVYPELMKLMKKDKKIDYLGEWHSHPSGPMHASSIDHMSMKEMVNNPEFGELKWVILLIFLPDQKIISYYYENKSYSIVECKLK